MSDVYILVQCDEANVVPLRKAMIAAKTPTKHVSSVVISDRVFVPYYHHVDATFTSIKSVVMERVQAEKDGKLVTAVQCAWCDRWGSSFRKAGNLTRFLKRNGWVIWGDVLICGKCADGRGHPFSIFDPEYRGVVNKPRRVRIA